jgi:aspartyl-tRNA(Asn)/glutamyl-tRNA(Gln) amidotransferase subunit C
VKLDNKLLEKLENLSHLNISDSKREEIISQLSDILEYVENLSELDTSNIDSYFSTLEGGTPLREDEPYCNKQINESILKNAPLSEDNFFIVPAIIE